MQCRFTLHNNSKAFEPLQKAIIICPIGASSTDYLKCLNPHFHFVHKTDAYDGIIDFAEQNNSDIILTIPKKHAFYHKSRTKQLLFNASFTVMTMQ